MPPKMYAELARYYDRMYGFKEYRREAVILRRLARRFGQSGGDRWVDVGCGTAEHLRYLRAWYRVEGIDRSREMLAEARKKLGNVPLHRAAMSRFALAEPADVLTCLFSAIGYLTDEATLLRAYRCFYRALRPGGVALIEPWITPAGWRPGGVHLIEYRGKGVAIARMNVSTRRGNRSVLDLHYLVGDRRGVRHFVDRHVQLLLPIPRHLALLKRAGFAARFDARSMPLGRGLLIAVRPGSAA